MDDQKSLRLLFLGAGRTGKTNIIQRFLTNKFEEIYHPTVEDIFQRECFVRNCLIDIEILDTGGYYNFIGMRKIYIRTSVAFVLIFSQDSYSSFEMCKHFYEEMKQEKGDELFSTPIVIACNKSDLVETEIGEKIVMDWLSASQLKPSQFVYCSAKNNENIIDVFESLWIQNFNSENPLTFLDLRVDNKPPRRFSSVEVNKLQNISSSFFCSTNKKRKDNQRTSESSKTNSPISTGSIDSDWNLSPTRSIDGHLKKSDPSNQSQRLKRHSTKSRRKYRNQIHLNCIIS